MRGAQSERIFEISLALPGRLARGRGDDISGIIGFFAVLITGQWPEGLREFIVGVHRWAYRVQAYVFLLTDAYPPFQLD